MRKQWQALGLVCGAVTGAIGVSSAWRITELHSTDKNVISNGKSTSRVCPIVDQLKEKEYNATLEDCIFKSTKICKQIKTELGLPGLVVGVSVNGKKVWEDGFGHADLENGVRMKPNKVMRIASISKSMTMAMLAKLWEDGKIDFDKPIQHYLPEFPKKHIEGECVDITTRHLLSHLSGIRHYEKKGENRKGNDDNGNDEMELKEYYLKERFKTTKDALTLFVDDELHHKPGTKYLYSTHAWTVVAAIIEKLVDLPFHKYSKRMFNHWGLENTKLDEPEPLIRNRTRYYCNKKGKIQNSPYVDNSYKWAGGGFLSTVGDLMNFAHIMLYSYQKTNDSDSENGRKPFLKQETVKRLWTSNLLASKDYNPDDIFYGLGFTVGEPMEKCMFCKKRDIHVIGHSGSAVGASSILSIVIPEKRSSELDQNEKESENHVQGVVVAMITNLTGVSLSATATKIANIFKELV